MRAPRIGSLFSGYGGLEMGVQAAIGGSTAWVSDIDKGACKILAHRYPDVPNLGDISAVDWSQVEPVDVLTGGFPCQDVSHAGKRAGLKPDTRTGLWSQMAYAIDQLRPALVVAENVRGLLSAEAHSDVEPCSWCLGDPGDQPVLRALGAVLGDLADLGYDASWYGLRAADVGAPHGRFRVFVVAYPQGVRSARAVKAGRIFSCAKCGTSVSEMDDSVRARSCRNCREWMSSTTPATHLLPTPRAREMEESVDSFAARQQRMADAGRVKGDSGMPLSVAVNLLPTPAVNDMGAAYTPDEWDAWTDRMKAEHGNGNGHGKSLSIEAARLLPTPVVTDAAASGNRPIDKASHPGTSLTDALVRGQGYMDRPQDTSQWGDYTDAVARWESLLDRRAPAPTQVGAKGNSQLSPRFVEWLMGLPAGHVTDVPGITRNEALKALGNGVVPQQAEAALRVLLPASEAVA